MGTFGVYTGAKKIRPEKAEEFSHSVSKILYYGGMMHLEEVKMYDIKLTLLEPVRIEAEQDTSFRYNYFEDDVWEPAGYHYENQKLWSEKIGWSEFNYVITAVHCLYELYDEEPGITLVNKDIVSGGIYTGWINSLLNSGHSLKNRFRIWDHVERYMSWMTETSLEPGFVFKLFPPYLRQYAGGTDLADLLYITHGTKSLEEEVVVPDSYPDDVLQCRRCIAEILRKEGSQAGYELILSLLQKNRDKRRRENAAHVKELAEMSLVLPARVPFYLLTELTERNFWTEWEKQKKTVYHDEKMKQYASAVIRNYRKKGREEPVEKTPTSIALRRTGGFAFYDTPDELRKYSNYYLNDSDRLYWWDGSEEVRIGRNTEKWLLEMGNRILRIKGGLPEICDTQKYVRHMMEVLNEVNMRYKRVFAFQEMFYEFIEKANDKNYRAAISLLEELSEENKELGQVIGKAGSWDIANKNVLCNPARMKMKRYLSLLANRKLREQYLGF